MARPGPCHTEPVGAGAAYENQAEHLADRLDDIVAELDDLAFAALREAAAGSGQRPAVDKRLTQARRAVEKAAHLLRNASET